MVWIAPLEWLLAEVEIDHFLHIAHSFSRCVVEIGFEFARMSVQVAIRVSMCVGYKITCQCFKAGCGLFGRRQILFGFILVEDLREEVVHRLEDLERRGRRQIEVVVHVVVADAAVVMHQTTVDLDYLHGRLADASFGQQFVHLVGSVATAVRVLATWKQRLSNVFIRTH